MKKRVLILLIVIILGPYILQAQKILTLKECYDKAYTANALQVKKTGILIFQDLKMRIL